MRPILHIILWALTAVLGQSFQPTPFQKFVFAPNNVCVLPHSFYCPINGNETSSLEFTMRNVPGEGDCMFLAVALATSTSMGLGGNNALLRAVANETRGVVADVLGAESGHLHVEGKRIVRVADLLKSAARNEGLETGEDYLEMLRNGSLQGGGPELTVLSNVLRRPISIYELDSDWWEAKSKASVGDVDGGIDQVLSIPDRCRLKCVGSFGTVFRDPLADIPDSVVLSGLQEGAYSWHIHVLVVDSGFGEKHACALLPKQCYV